MLKLRGEFAPVNNHVESVTMAAKIHLVTPLPVCLQDGHPDRLQCGLEVGGRLFMLDLEKNQ